MANRIYNTSKDPITSSGNVFQTEPRISIKKYPSAKYVLLSSLFERWGPGRRNILANILLVHIMTMSGSKLLRYLLAVEKSCDGLKRKVAGLDDEEVDVDELEHQPADVDKLHSLLTQ